jgi:hypothetical protein
MNATTPPLTAPPVSPAYGAIPPGYIRPGENVLIEGRPNERAFVTMGLLIVLGVLGLIWLLIIVAVGLAAGAVDAVIVAVVLFFLLPLIPLILIYRARRQHRASWYALTDQRVIVAGTGLSAFSSVATDFPLRVPPGMQMAGITLYQVKQISVSQTYFGKRYGFGNVVFLAQPSSFVWTGVNNAVAVRTQLETLFNQIQESQYMARGAQEKFDARVADHFVVQNEDMARAAAANMAPAGVPAGTTVGPGARRRVLVGNQVMVNCVYCGRANPEGSAKCAGCGKGLEV